MNAKTTNIIGYVIAALLSLQFLASAAGKLSGGAAEQFAIWGYDTNFMYLIGVLEALGAIGLWIPKLRKWAGFGLVGIMLGAIYTHLMHGEYPGVGVNLFVIGMIFLLLKFRKDV